MKEDSFASVLLGPMVLSAAINTEGFVFSFSVLKNFFDIFIIFLFC